MNHIHGNQRGRHDWVLLTMIVLSTISREAQTAELTDIFVPGEMRDPSTLDLRILGQETIPAASHPARQFTRINLEFTSFHWAGEEWRHRAMVFLPDQRPQVYRGAGVIVSSPRLDHKVNLRYAESAALLGIPTLMIASHNPGPHYGHHNEGNLMGYGAQRFRETGDPNWIGYAWLGKVIVRAVTAAGQVPGFDADRFVVTGCSKRGAAAWIAAGADDRIIGAYPTCWNAGNFDAWLDVKASRWGLDYQPNPGQKSIAPAFITTRQQIENARRPRSGEAEDFTDPFRFRHRLREKRVLYSAGTNDPLFPVASDPVFLSQMPQTIRILLVPNGGHGLDTQRNRTAWRMWLAHCFADRDVPQIMLTRSRNSGRLSISATVVSTTQIKAVRCWSASDNRGAYLDADWQATEMSADGDSGFSVALPIVEDTFLSYFVEVEDADPQTVPGLVTTGFQEWTE